MSTQVIDVHAHHVGTHAIERIRDEGADHQVRLVTREVAGKPVTRVEVAGRPSGLPLLPQLSDVAARLAWMDAAGVDVQLVAPWMDLAGYELPPDDGLWLARVQNDSAAALAAQDRFLPAAAVPLQHPGYAVAELRRAVTELGHVAVQIGARVNDLGLDDPSLDPFWDAADELGVPVIVHPAELDVPERSRRLFLHILVGNPSETTFAAAALLLGGVLERRPGLRVLLVHGGGFVPYQIGRLERGFTAAPVQFRAKGGRSPRDLLGQLFFDTVLHDDDALRHLLDFAGAERVLLGSDYPFPMRTDRPVEALDAVKPDGVEREAVLGAASLLAGGVSP
ncbi:amidohydrolase family protein [Streptomyces sp. TS71-3]|uniref:amidohydrolase family protein n=1 Tax=Streptomyces sp. TS71-3 TaxID=2733862 RepID=UPI001B1547F0|nr:amidohydrolase family protein [Streptomyces sp. TS71-3]GHJ41711.1 amidohydrolase [Streptomyces sp. TS71-3]